MSELELELEYEELTIAVENGEITEEEARAELWWDSLDNGYD